jgi:hypothetical protein
MLRLHSLFPVDAARLAFQATPPNLAYGPQLKLPPFSVHNAEKSLSKHSNILRGFFVRPAKEEFKQTATRST